MGENNLWNPLGSETFRNDVKPGAGPLVNKWLGALGAGCLIGCPGMSGAQTIDELRAMSIGDLADIEVSSVSKTAQPLAQAPAAIFLITSDMIARSGATTLPEILRLAPNLQVYRQSAAEYAITARGQNGNSAAQSFSNKLLVLIDGRSVYSPLYSGVYWDMQDVLPQDIDRIEVISGPGATLWGANAVNGVINIITHGAGETQGLLVHAQGGAHQRSLGLRYGGDAGEALAWRVSLNGLDMDETHNAAGAGQEDDWRRLQGSFRLDWTPDSNDRVMLQGALYGGERKRRAGEAIEGHSVMARWNHSADNGNELQVKAYYDSASRRSTANALRFWVHTLDLDLQHAWELSARQKLVWGGNVRASRYHLDATGPLDFEPSRRTLWLASAFAQTTLDLTDRLSLTAGLKVESDPYVGASLLPDVRLSWRPSETATFWGAVSRAVRSPTPFDSDVLEYLDGQLFLTGNPDFRTEKLTAFQFGGRFRPASSVSFSVTGYYNLYDDLRSIELGPNILPLLWGNELTGESYGVELWGSFRPLDWWTLSASLNLYEAGFHFRPGSSQLLGTAQIGSDPREQASLRSSMTFGAVTIDADLRHMGSLPDPVLPAHTEVDARIGWQLASGLEVSLTGDNLLHRWRQEYPGGSRLPREIRIGLQWAL